MNIFTKAKKYLILIIPLLLISCGDNNGGKVSKGHRDAIKQECAEDPDKKLCGMEVRAKFIEDGNEFVTLEELNKDQKRRIKMECIRSKQYGLVSYNDCLEGKKIAANNGVLTELTVEKKPKSNIDRLKSLTYYVEIGQGGEGGHGTGVAVAKNIIATNCHVVFGKDKKNNIDFDKPAKEIFIRDITEENKLITEAKIFKTSNNDICLIKTKKKNFKFISSFKKFEKLKVGEFVRAIGNPSFFIGHSSSGEINKLMWQEKNKWILHNSAIGSGSSGGPLFDKDGSLIGLNTLVFSDKEIKDFNLAGNFNIAVSADHIKELLNK